MPGMSGSLRTTRETGLLSGRFYHTTKNNGKGIRTLALGRTYAACPAANRQTRLSRKLGLF
jgi:hypothetical protein